MAEPTKTVLRDLRDQLAEHANTPLPPELYRQLHGLINWATWRIDRAHLTRAQIRYQRWRVVHEGIRQFIVTHHGGTRGSRPYGYSYAASKLAGGPYAGSYYTMKQDFLAEERGPSARRREALEQRAREADRALQRRRPRPG